MNPPNEQTKKQIGNKTDRIEAEQQQQEEEEEEKEVEEKKNIKRKN